MMNKVILIGRLTSDPEIRNASGKTVARYRLAVDRQFKQEGQPEADFLTCVAFGKGGEFAEKYLTKGTKIAVEGRIQTGSYTKDDGSKVYTTDIIVERHEFCESKKDGFSGGGSLDAVAAIAEAAFGGTSGGFAPIEDDDTFPF